MPPRSKNSLLLSTMETSRAGERFFMGRIRACVRLTRSGNLPTAWADILTGAVLIRLAFGSSPWPRPGPTAWLLGATSCLYAAGMVFNDYADREEDARLRPERPLPAGALSPRGALFFGLSLAAVGLLCAATAGLPAPGGGHWDGAPLVQAAIVLCAVFLYDFSAKRVAFLGPLTLGLCRGFNLQLGMSGDANFAAHWNWALFAGEQAELAQAVLWGAPLALCLYATGVTVFSTNEERGLRPRTAFRGWLWLLTAAVIGAAACRVLSLVGGRTVPVGEVPTARAFLWCLVPWGVLYLLLAAKTVSAVRATGKEAPAAAKRLVLAGVAGMCLFDAGLLSGGGGMRVMLPAVVCAVFFPLVLYGGFFRRGGPRPRREA